MFIIIDLNSNNVETLKSFQAFLLKNKMSQKLNIFYNFYSKKSKIKNFTVLKSPHVNKTAQEQFNYCSYKTTVILFSPNFLLVLYYLKLISNKLFPTLTIKIKICFNTTFSHKKFKQCFNPNKFIIERNKSQVIQNYLLMFDLFGQFSYKTV